MYSQPSVASSNGFAGFRIYLPGISYSDGDRAKGVFGFASRLTFSLLFILFSFLIVHFVLVTLFIEGLTILFTIISIISTILKKKLSIPHFVLVALFYV